MYITREGRVAEFNSAGGVGTVSSGGNLALAVTNFSEELAEFNEAMAEYIANPSEETREAMVKEWADVQFTLSGIAYYFEFDGEEAFTRVANNNMTKVSSDGTIKKRADGKILKPEGYKKPDMKGL
ncbi:MAG: hypothetical protein Unbinned2691contig1000_13 [Prokaryotic dsDNA virus sp.]|nr:MAG: hypothetical protein Unbinned2691contig1000_13 [Prokaryotic dsDNA virus sp.]|tara:strand:- start:38422 stop:38799 length:378 start_codon:yes stop_codon:yes gene_type:complete